MKIKNIRAKCIMFSLYTSLCVIGYAQNNLIPNAEDCSGTRPPFAFNIRTAWTSSTNNAISTCSTPLAGDLDGDGITEIVAFGDDKTKLYILDGRNGDELKTLTILGHTSAGTSNVVLTKINGVGAIFNAGTDGTMILYSVSSTPGVRPIQFQQQWSVSSGLYIGPSMPIATDFDGDGIVEFVAGKYIIDSQDGTVLATLPYRSESSPEFRSSFHYALDLDGDELPEIVSGTEVYKFSRNTNPNLQLWRSLSSISGGGSKRDGTSMGADVNQDGNVDLVFYPTEAVGGDMVIWTPQTSIIIGSIPHPGSDKFHSYPFVGDIDGVISSGKKYPEIVIITARQLTAYKFNGTSFVQKWTMSNSDASGATSITLFDFNLDGMVELVYRDETQLQIFDGSADNTAPSLLYSQTSSSLTCNEAPIIADVTGDGSADIIVTGRNDGQYLRAGEIDVFEGGASKWASCPPVWNQQFYSPLHVNADLTIPTRIKPVNLTFTRTDNSTVEFYNGGPMQAPYVSEETYLPIDLSPDVYVVSGTLAYNGSSVTLTITFGNQGFATAQANTPIRYYKNSIASGNIIGNETLGVNLAPGQTQTITKTITGLSPMPAQFYVRILDDGAHFPATGAFSDCNLTNNTKSFGTLEVRKTVNSTNACVDGTSIFNIELINNTNLTQSPQIFDKVVLIDSLGSGWTDVSATTIDGSVGSYSSTTRKIQWNVPSIAQGATAKLVITAKATVAAAIRNSAWVASINNTAIGKEVIEAYVTVDSEHAPAKATILPANRSICGSGSIELSASVSGKSSYQ
ncbi:MAG: DUF11 domain-containing protein, partial [Prevotellaceae bacterium]|nr:DUF11 domain-containing protein [Prevotellaceae bacterium]